VEIYNGFDYLFVEIHGVLYFFNEEKIHPIIVHIIIFYNSNNLFNDDIFNFYVFKLLISSKKHKNWKNLKNRKN
jgi:hypothetical protein